MDGGSLLLRWLHVIAGIAWIGSSFYFMHLDAGVRPAPDIPAGKGGPSLGGPLAAASIRCANGS